MSSKDRMWVSYLWEVLRRKRIAINSLKRLEEDKKRISDEIPMLLAEINRRKGGLFSGLFRKKRGIKEYIDEVAPYLRNPKSEEGKKLAREATGIHRMIVNNFALLRLIRMMLNVEISLTQNINLMMASITGSEYFGLSQDERNKIERLFRSLLDISSKAILLLESLLQIGKREGIVERNIAGY